MRHTLVRVVPHLFYNTILTEIPYTLSAFVLSHKDHMAGHSSAYRCDQKLRIPLLLSIIRTMKADEKPRVNAPVIKGATYKPFFTVALEGSSS